MTIIDPAFIFFGDHPTMFNLAKYVSQNNS